MEIGEVTKGRPADDTARAETERKTYDLLDQAGVSYDRVDHSPVFTMEHCEKIDRVLETQSCKNLFLCNRRKTQYYLLMIPAGKKFHTKDLTGQIPNGHLSFANDQDMQRHLHLTPGSVSVLGLMNDREQKVSLLVDEELLHTDTLGCHPCVNTSTLKLTTADVFGPVLKAMGHEMTVVKLPDYSKAEKPSA